MCSRNRLAESLPAKVGAPFRGRRNPEAASYSFILVIYLFQRRTAAVLDTDHWVGAFSQGHSTRHKSAVRPSGLHETKWGFSFLQWEQGSISKSSSCSTIKTAPHQTFLPSASARKRRSSNRPYNSYERRACPETEGAQGKAPATFPLRAPHSGGRWAPAGGTAVTRISAAFS